MTTTPNQPGHGALNDLTARLEKAAGPDRNLDCEIWVAANGKGQPMKIIGQPYYETPRFFCNPNPEVNWIGYDLLNNARPYTASLDAAMSLVPEKWRVCQVGEHQPSKHERRAWHAQTELRAVPARYVGVVSFHEIGATGPLALCIAALKARAATTPESSQ